MTTRRDKLEVELKKALEDYAADRFVDPRAEVTALELLTNKYLAENTSRKSIAEVLTRIIDSWAAEPTGTITWHGINYLVERLDLGSKQHHTNILYQRIKSALNENNIACREDSHSRHFLLMAFVNIGGRFKPIEIDAEENYFSSTNPDSWLKYFILTNYKNPDKIEHKLLEYFREKKISTGQLISLIPIIEQYKELNLNFLQNVLPKLIDISKASKNEKSVAALAKIYKRITGIEPPRPSFSDEKKTKPFTLIYNQMMSDINFPPQGEESEVNHEPELV
tara:strand:- start:2676 stop:3515 length:840 start_codon:yes stop_codon:yes gene_type:complete